MKYYRLMKAALIVALILLICLWFYGCDRFTQTDLPKPQLIKTAIFKDVKIVIAAALSDCYAQIWEVQVI
ncbi:hypothetical protein ACM55H_09995 [Flavobacterium sp. ZT3R17]|uniref:hypothetical protein n=1 Tax=Flavobacterium cryoconiti TaxID=3398736 RepID=UPI003A8A55C0